MCTYKAGLNVTGIIKILIFFLLLYLAAPELERRILSLCEPCECQKIEEGGRP
jgi:hypothetical protein